MDLGPGGTRIAYVVKVVRYAGTAAIRDCGVYWQELVGGSIPF